MGIVDLTGERSRTLTLIDVGQTPDGESTSWAGYAGQKIFAYKGLGGEYIPVETADVSQMPVRIPGSAVREEYAFQS